MTLYKVVIRILVGRLKEVILRLVSEEQAAFIPGRAISDDIFCAQELTHSLKTAKREDGLVMAKLDMERGYNRINWAFLGRVLRGMGFDETWISWVMCCDRDLRFAILVNGSSTEWFRSTTGNIFRLRKVDFVYKSQSSGVTKFSRILSKSFVLSQARKLMQGSRPSWYLLALGNFARAMGFSPSPLV